MKIKIKYFSEDYPRLEKIEQGDWIDLRVDNVISYSDSIISKLKNWISSKFKQTEDVSYRKGDVLFIGLGVAMELPKGYEAHVLPRSSTFKNTGLILTNGMGIIDESYCGDDDEWSAMVIATRDGILKRHDRLFQFRIVKNQPEIEMEEVKELGNPNRGGYGSTGRK